MSAANASASRAWSSAKCCGGGVTSAGSSAANAAASASWIASRHAVSCASVGHVVSEVESSNN